MYWAIQRSWFARVNARGFVFLSRARCRGRGGRSALPGRFLSRPRCFTLCITVEVEPRIAKQYKCQYCCSCKNYRWKGMEGGKKKCLCVVLGLTRRSQVRRKKCVLGHPIARATGYCLLADTLWPRASKNAFKVGSVKFANSLSPLWRKYAPEVKAAKGLKRCRAKVKGVNNPAWIAHQASLSGTLPVWRRIS